MADTRQAFGRELADPRQPMGRFLAAFWQRFGSVLAGFLAIWQVAQMPHLNLASI